MKVYKAIITEDEINNILIIKHFILTYCPNIEIIGEAYTVSEAIQEINQKRPDILFLDVMLNEEVAFTVLDNVDYSNLQIIFVTAYDEYAIKAFKYNAIDYILKPLAIEDIILAVNKVIKKLEQQTYFDFQNLSKPSKSFLESSDSKEYIAIPSMNKIDLIKSEDILYVEAESKYAIFNLKGGKRLVSNKSLLYYEGILDATYFFRVHNTYIINLKFLVRIIKKNGSYCELSNGSLIPISKRKQEDFNRFLRIKE